MLASGSASSCTSSVGSGATGTSGSVVALSSSGFWRGALDWNGFRDHGSLDLCLCHYNVHDVSTRGL
jgi:hypothetical protein